MQNVSRYPHCRIIMDELGGGEERKKKKKKKEKGDTVSDIN